MPVKVISFWPGRSVRAIGDTWLGAGCVFDSVCSLFSKAHEYGHFWETEKMS